MINIQETSANSSWRTYTCTNRLGSGSFFRTTVIRFLDLMYGFPLLIGRFCRRTLDWNFINYACAVTFDTPLIIGTVGKVQMGVGMVQVVKYKVQ